MHLPVLTEETKTKGKRYSEDQILSILQEIEEGAGKMASCRKHIVCQASVHRWRGQC